MPILKYFLWVGGGLLALLFAADFYVPRQPEQSVAQHTYNIPITSGRPAGPQALTFSGETRDFGAPPPMTVVDFAAHPGVAAEMSAGQARAEMTGTTSPAAQAAKPARQKVAKRKVNRPRDPVDHDPDTIPDGWRPGGPTGLAFARPFSW